MFEYTIKSCEFRTKRVCWGWQKSHENVLRLQLGAGQRNWSSNNFVFGNLVSDKKLCRYRYSFFFTATGTTEFDSNRMEGFVDTSRGLAEEPPKCSQLDLRLGTEPYNIQL